MVEESAGRFGQIGERVAHGDLDALGDLLEHYAPYVQTVIRHRLRQHKRKILQSAMDSTDLLQSTWVELLRGIERGQIHLSTPAGMARLLATIAYRKVDARVTQAQAECRDVRRVATKDVLDTDLQDDGLEPSNSVTFDELLDFLKQHLTHQEWAVVQYSSSGWTWQRIARKYDVSPDAARIRFRRAFRRIAERWERHLHSQQNGCSLRLDW